jgi:hypothetical protein
LKTRIGAALQKLESQLVSGINPIDDSTSSFSQATSKEDGAPNEEIERAEQAVTEGKKALAESS